MADEEAVDRHLGVVLEELIEAIQETKQAEWTAPDARVRRALDDMREFLVEHCVAVADAEARIGGRSPALVTPTAHQPRDLGAEAGGDGQAMLRVLLADLRAVAEDTRARAREIAGWEEAALFTTVADGLDERLARIPRPAAGA